MDRPAKKELKRRARAERRASADVEWDEHMVLEPEQLKALLDHLDGELPSRGCDDTLRLTRQWAARSGVEPENLAESLAFFGGGCDCEVLANVDPETDVAGWPSYVARFGSR